VPRYSRGEGVDQGPRALGWRRAAKVGAASAPQVRVEGELLDHEDLTADVQGGEVHAAVGVREGTQVYDLLSQGFRGGRVVVLTDSEQD
jgi:hypothetical protein